MSNDADDTPQSTQDLAIFVSWRRAHSLLPHKHPITLDVCFAGSGAELAAADARSICDHVGHHHWAQWVTRHRLHMHCSHHSLVLVLVMLRAQSTRWVIALTSSKTPSENSWHRQGLRTSRQRKAQRRWRGPPRHLLSEVFWSLSWDRLMRPADPRGLLPSRSS